MSKETVDNVATSDLPLREGTTEQTVLHTLGRKARERLQQEREKRPEIMVLKEVDNPEAKKTNYSSNIVDSQTAALHSRKRQRRLPPSKKEAQTLPSQNTSDYWLPDVSQVRPCTKENRSNVVALHGLPVGTTKTHILNFLSGIKPQRIMMLPSLAERIPEIDARESLQESRKIKVERISHATRILIKFDSSTIAELAVKRSGELLHRNNEHAAPIVVTQIPKPIAPYLVNHLAYDITKDDDIENIAKTVEDGLAECVPKILWASAVESLGLSLTTTPFSLRSSVVSARVSDNRDLLKQNRDRLVEIRNDIVRRPPFPCVDHSDPSLQRDPVVRLSTSAFNCLDQEIDRINDIILRETRLQMLRR